MRCCWCGVSRQDLVCKYPAGLVQGVRGAPAPVVEFLPGASAALVQGVAGEVYDVEGVHDCLCGACLIVCVSVFLFERIDA